MKRRPRGRFTPRSAKIHRAVDTSPYRGIRRSARRSDEGTDPTEGIILRGILESGAMRYVIVGGGPAGFSAARALRGLDLQGRVTMLTKEAEPPYARIALPYLVHGAVDKALLFLPMPDGVVMMRGEEAREIDPGRREVRTSSGRTISYDRLLLATGADPLKPDIPGIDLPLVFTIRDLANAQADRDRLRTAGARRAVVAGAGPVGLELGDALLKAGCAVTFVVGSDRLFSAMLDAPASAFLERRLAAKGIEIRKNDNLAAILPSGTASLSSGARVPCDIVIVGKGVSPRIDYLSGASVRARRGILVDKYQQTNVPGIYAAGDAAETADIVHGDSRINALWPEALEQGKVAACNMAGRPLAYEGSFSRNVMRVFETTIQAAGMTQGDEGRADREEGRDFHSKLVLDNGILKGFIFLGDVRSVGFYSDLVRRKVPVSSFAGSLRRGSLDYARFVKERILEHQG